MSQPTARVRRSTRIGAAMLVSAYALVILAIANRGHPLERTWLLGIALLPAMVVAAAGIPRVIRGRPRGLLAVFHLIVYPGLAAVSLGIPGAYLALRLSELFGG